MSLKKNLDNVKAVHRSSFYKKCTDRLDKIYMHILDDSLVLTTSDASYFELIKKAYPIIIGQPSYHEALLLLQSLGVSMHVAIGLYTDTQKIYGKINPPDKAFAKAAMRARLGILIGSKIDVMAKIQAEKLLMKLDSLDQAEKTEEGPFVLPGVVFTSDISALGDGAKIIFDNVDEAEIIDDDEE